MLQSCTVSRLPIFRLYIMCYHAETPVCRGLQSPLPQLGGSVLSWDESRYSTSNGAPGAVATFAH